MNNRLAAWLLAVVIFAQGSCVMPPAAAPSAGLRPAPRLTPARLQAEIDRLLAAVPAQHIGVHLVDVDTAEVLYARRADEHFVPASCLKIVTGAAALAYLGPTYRFVTDLATDALERGGRGVHHLYLRGSGDPDLGEADLRAFASRLRQQGVAAISGDIVLDDTAFEPPSWGRGWMWDDLPEGYSAAAGALNLQHNELVMTLTPGPKVEAPARLSLSPATPLFSVTANVSTSARGTQVHLTPAAGDDLGLAPGQGLALTGQVTLGGGAWTDRRAIRDGALACGAVLLQALRAEHIEVRGEIRRGQVPADALWLTRHSSPELGALLTDAMKASNNHTMECLLRRLGANTTLGPGSAAGGVRAVQSFLAQQVGLDAHQLAVADGSGASRYSLVSPSQLTALLQAMHRSFAVGPEFVASLPIGGLDGTLAGRFAAPLLHGQVRAKTGTMTGIVNLAGYVAAPGGRRLAFAILADGLLGPADAQRRLQEAILLAVVDPPG